MRNTITVRAPSINPCTSRKAAIDVEVRGRYRIDMENQMVHFQRSTGPFPVAAGWREMGYFSSAYYTSSDERWTTG